MFSFIRVALVIVSPHSSKSLTETERKEKEKGGGGVNGKRNRKEMP
jgi:hypothetical protein